MRFWYACLPEHESMAVTDNLLSVAVFYLQNKIVFANTESDSERFVKKDFFTSAVLDRQKTREES